MVRAATRVPAASSARADRETGDICRRGGRHARQLTGASPDVNGIVHPCPEMMMHEVRRGTHVRPSERR